jgi:hypothetical protein
MSMIATIKSVTKNRGNMAMLAVTPDGVWLIVVN